MAGRAVNEISRNFHIFREGYSLKVPTSALTLKNLLRPYVINVSLNKISKLQRFYGAIAIGY